MKLLIVESPSKAKTLGKWLPKDFKVTASFGHIRDLPSKAGSVLPDEDFLMKYEVNDNAKKHVKEISDLAKEAEEIYLAPDPDREGEAIAWHIVEVLKQKKIITKSKKVYRVVFNEITKITSDINIKLDVLPTNLPEVMNSRMKLIPLLDNFIRTGENIMRATTTFNNAKAEYDKIL